MTEESGLREEELKRVEKSRVELELAESGVGLVLAQELVSLLEHAAADRSRALSLSPSRAPCVCVCVCV